MAAGLNLTEGAAPSTPGAATHDLYVDVSGNFHTLSDAGADKTLATNTIEFATANVADEAITNAKLAQMAEATVKGRAADAGTGDVSDLTVEELAAILAEHFTQSENDADWTNLTTDYSTTASLLNPDPYSHTYAVPGYRKAGEVVFLRGTAVARQVLGNGALMGTLPSGYRPAYDAMYVGRYAYSTYILNAIVWVYANGEIRTENGWVTYHLDGICFVPA